MLPRGEFFPGPNSRHKETVYCDCPCCGYKNALAITERKGRALYHCHAGCTQQSLWRVIRDQEPRLPVAEPCRQFSDATAFVRYLWDTSLPAAGTTVEAYLRSRQIEGLLPPSLRSLPNHPHSPTGKKWPVMLAAVVDADGKLRALHRTYLRSDGSGKADVEPAKMTLGSIRGFSSHLGDAGEELAVAEGIETGLSFQLSTGIPTWAALNTGGMRTLLLPPRPLASFVTIAADADEPGLKAAEAAAARWRADGRHVRIVTPPKPGLDFNDMLNKAGL
jgi:phage/plasmid primase-like uncharacterized protein